MLLVSMILLGLLIKISENNKKFIKENYNRKKWMLERDDIFLEMEIYI